MRQDKTRPAIYICLSTRPNVRVHCTAFQIQEVPLITLKNAT